MILKLISDNEIPYRDSHERLLVQDVQHGAERQAHQATREPDPTPHRGLQTNNFKGAPKRKKGLQNWEIVIGLKQSLLNLPTLFCLLAQPPIASTNRRFGEDSGSKLVILPCP